MKNGHRCIHTHTKPEANILLSMLKSFPLMSHDEAKQHVILVIRLRSFGYVMASHLVAVKREQN